MLAANYCNLLMEFFLAKLLQAVFDADRLIRKSTLKTYKEHEKILLSVPVYHLGFCGNGASNGAGNTHS